MLNETISRRSALMAVLSFGLTGCWLGQSTTTVQIEPRATFIEPTNGAIVTSPFRVRFGVVGAVLRPVGDPTPGSGHHHLLIDRGCPVPDGKAIPFNAEVIHYGDAATGGWVDLPEGEHTLIAQLGNASHKAFGVTATIHITVVGPG